MSLTIRNNKNLIRIGPTSPQEPSNLSNTLKPQKLKKSHTYMSLHMSHSKYSSNNRALPAKIKRRKRVRMVGGHTL